MTTRFVVDGQEKEVEMLVNGVDISGDFIGNTVHGMKTDEEGRYIATREDYDWWVETIGQHEEMEALIAIYKAVRDPDSVDAIVNDWIGGVDLEDQPGQARLGLETNFGRLNNEPRA